jgi:CRP-like cAMP-binding protein
MSDIHVGPGHLEALRSVPVFAGLDEETLGRLAEVATEVELPKGHVLIERDQEGSGLLVVLDGAVQVQVGDDRIDKGAGEFFGELSLLVPGLKHTARVQAVSPVRCLAIRRDDVEALLAEHPRIAVGMLRVLARRLAETLSLL